MITAKRITSERGTVTIDFEVYELPTLATIGKLAEVQAYGADAPEHVCTDTVGMYASMFSNLCEIAAFAAKMTVDPDAPMTLEGYRAHEAYWTGVAFQKDGVRLVDAAKAVYPTETAAIEGQGGVA